MADEQTINVEQQRFLLSLPAIFVNKFFVTRREKTSLIRLAVAEGCGDNVSVRGTYMVTLADLIEFRNLLTRTIDGLTADDDTLP
jgi:hypothetical protein